MASVSEEDSRPDFRFYAGKWIAVAGGRVIAQGGTPDQVRRSAAASRYKEKVHIMYVPTENSIQFHPVVNRLKHIFALRDDIYLVGGVVRDGLLGKQSKDIDLVVPEKAIKTARMVADELGGAFFPLNEDFDAGRVVLKPDEGARLMIDVTALRGPTLEEDLLARDFTINAIAVPIADQDKLYDPLGGAGDLVSKRLRACSKNSMRDDPVRILRGIRLAANYKLMIDPDTRRLMRAAVSGLEQVSPERQRDELFHILDGPQPAVALRALDMLGALERLLPEMMALKGLQQSPPHDLDGFMHTLRVIQKLEDLLDLLSKEGDPEAGAAGNLMDGLTVQKLGRYRQQIQNHLRKRINPDRDVRALVFFGAAYHDIGKPQVQEQDTTGRIRFFGHDAAGAEISAMRARALRLSNPEVNRLELIVRYHMRPLLLTNSGRPPSRRAIYRFFRDAREAGVDICLLSLADFLGTYEMMPPQDLWAAHLDTIRSLLAGWWENDPVTINPRLFLDGNELIKNFGLAPGPLIGQILERLREAQAIGVITSRAQAEVWVAELLDQKKTTETN
ncbi:MAG: DUF5678 domain-containing protein [Anaerolineales bacterium]